MSHLRAALNAGDLDPRQLAFREDWLPAAPLWRVYSEAFGPVGFNDTDRPFARFSPLRRPDNSIVPVLYEGTTLDVALMESVFRNVPSPSSGHTLTLPSTTDEQRRVTRISLSSPIRVVDFSAIGLRRLGQERGEVIDCNSGRYDETQSLAAWVYAHTDTTVQGITWTSRQDDTGQAVVLFGDRQTVNGTAITPADAGQRLHAGEPLEAMTRLAERLGVYLQFA